MKLKQNLSNIIYYVFVIVLIVLILFFLRLLPFFPTVIASGSMQPAIEIGDIVVVDSLNDDLEINDIIQYRNEHYSVVHRIVDIEEDDEGNKFYITKGDDNKTKDISAVYSDQIEGKVILIIPEIGKITLWIDGFFK